jgi:hypothetical protein
LLHFFESSIEGLILSDLKIKEMLDRYTKAYETYEMVQKGEARSIRGSKLFLILIDSAPLSVEEAKSLMMDLMDAEPYKISRVRLNAQLILIL